ncbi:MAG TPA: tRNA uridine-5-carboxymethylaminomethyl(34) synthesis GTPase MnmE [Candidatus Eremiobacteraceae bacterium]|nr:tRNA uridine-5-carboxymethylaminomethyl(34) synthesis GTPase MnmE [Candidatus Eremiobacteraceae bacterium]
MDSDTIAAVATPPGVAAVAIVRMSGPRALAIVDACFEPSHPGRWRGSLMRRGWVRDPRSGSRIDDALAVAFPAPNSYTGEDVVELHVHGGAGVVGSVLLALYTSGARAAEAGEFTRRAFVNGRLDLAQAEAVADLIGAESRLAAKAAAMRLEGAVGRRLRELRDRLLAVLVEIEAHVDYPDEVEAPDAARIDSTLRAQRALVGELLAGAGAAQALRDGLDCVIAGPPNAGKSSLLNALLEAERAIVSDIPGTTRDVIEDRVAVDGVVLRLRDTAGLRATMDVIEGLGVERARAAIARAELVLLVIDGSRPLGQDERAALEATSAPPRIVLANKADLGDAGARELRTLLASSQDADDDLIAGSVRDAACVARVRAAIARVGWGGGVIDGNAALVASLRQAEALARASASLGHALETIDGGYPVDLLAADLRAAVGAYGEVTGETVTADVLDGIFSRFCVGK